MIKTFKTCAAALFVSHVIVSQASGESAYLIVTSEIGFPHSACLAEFSSTEQKWIGFRPKVRQPVGDGLVDLAGRQDFIDGYVRLKVDAQELRKAYNKVKTDFTGKKYVIFKRDCVSLSAQLARECGLDVAPKGNFEPAMLVAQLVEKNKQKVTHHNRRPFPWVVDRKQYSDKVSVWLRKVTCAKTETVTGADKVYVRVLTASSKIDLPQKKKMNNRDVWVANLNLIKVDQGQAIAIQLWDDDTFDPDDLIFDWTFTTGKLGNLKKSQTRGTSVVGSESKYLIEVEVRK